MLLHSSVGEITLPIVDAAGSVSLTILRRFLFVLTALVWAVPVSAGLRAELSDDERLYTHPHLHFTLEIPAFLQPSDLLEYLDPYAPSVDAAWLFPEIPGRITLGVFAGLGPFDLTTMAGWPGQKRAIVLPAGLPAFEQTSIVHRRFTIDIYVPHKASGQLILLSFAVTLPKHRKRLEVADVERVYAKEIGIFRAICSSFAEMKLPVLEKP